MLAAALRDHIADGMERGLAKRADCIVGMIEPTVGTDAGKSRVGQLPAAISKRLSMWSSDRSTLLIQSFPSHWCKLIDAPCNEDLLVLDDLSHEVIPRPIS